MRQKQKEREARPAIKNPVIKANGFIVSKKHQIALECSESSSE